MLKIEGSWALSMNCRKFPFLLGTGMATPYRYEGRMAVLRQNPIIAIKEDYKIQGCSYVEFRDRSYLYRRDVCSQVAKISCFVSDKMFS